MRAGTASRDGHPSVETFLVLEDELAFTAGQRTVPAPVGTVLYVPKGTQHSCAAVGPGPACVLFLNTPAGLEHICAAIDTPALPGVLYGAVTPSG